MAIPIFPGFVTLSSRGPGHRPFTAVTRVRIPLGSLCIFLNPEQLKKWDAEVAKAKEFLGYPAA
jgi:hypothetical protein